MPSFSFRVQGYGVSSELERSESLEYTPKIKRLLNRWLLIVGEVPVVPAKSPWLLQTSRRATASFSFSSDYDKENPDLFGHDQMAGIIDMGRQTLVSDRRTDIMAWFPLAEFSYYYDILRTKGIIDVYCTYVESPFGIPPIYPISSVGLWSFDWIS